MAITIKKRPCPDTDLEVNGTPEGTFAAGSTIEVNITDGVNPVTPDAVTVVGDVVTIEVPSGGGWQRPSDWLAMPTVVSTDQTFVGLYAVFASGQNYAAFTFTTSTGNYQVDWGDGTVTTHASNTIAQHEFDYATISNSTLSTKGYKQSLITVTPVSGNLLTCTFQVRYVTSPVQNQIYSTGFLDCILSMPNATALGITFGGGTVGHRLVERFDIKTIGGCTSLFNLFQGCASLVDIPLFNTSSVTGMSQMFGSCFSIVEVPLFNTANVTGMSQMFLNCNSLQRLPLFNTANVTNMTQMISGCASLQSIPLFNTSNVQTFSTFCNSSSSLKELPALSTSAVNADFVNFCISASSLMRIQMIFGRTVNLSNCQLSQTALVEIFNNLVDRSSTTSANINITGNWGATALTVGERAIATGKNWTITG
jgi:surface protein